MLVKIGNKIINPDQIVYAAYEDDGPPILNVYFVNIFAGNESTATALTFEGEEAKALWGLVAGDAKDVMQKWSRGSE